MKRVPHMELYEACPMLPKSPTSDTYPEDTPPGCARNCKKFYETHTKLISFALYATQDADKNPRQICAYAFSCGMELMGEKFDIAPGETPAQLIARVVPPLIRLFVEVAEEDAKSGDFQAH